MSLWGLLASAPLLAQQAPQERLEWSAQVRAGGEHDSNALRQNTEVARADFLMRYFGALDVTAQAPGAGKLALAIRQGGKLFEQERAADTLLTQVGLSWARPVVVRRRAGAALGLSLSLKDRTERTSEQDYTRLGASGDLQGWAGDWSAALSGGYGVFAYKPNPLASSQGPTLGASLAWRPTKRWRVVSSYSWLRRRFDTRQLQLQDEDPSGISLTPQESDREDAFQSVGLGVSWRGAVVVDGGYTLSLNRSNSYGQDLTRHAVQLTLTAPLVLGVLASGRVELQRTHYADPVFVDANFEVDEDNRNALVLSLSRHLWRGWDAELKYSLYTQEFGAGSAYRRRLLMLAIGWTYDDT